MCIFTISYKPLIKYKVYFKYVDKITFHTRIITCDTYGSHNPPNYVAMLRL